MTSNENPTAASVAEVPAEKELGENQVTYLAKGDD